MAGEETMLCLCMIFCFRSRAEGAGSLPSGKGLAFSRPGAAPCVDLQPPGFLRAFPFARGDISWKMTQPPGHQEHGACSCHPSPVQSVHQTLDEMDFERGIWNAALNGDLEGIKRHVLSCGKPNEPDPFGYTALHYASRNGHEDICHFLLGHGASCNVRTHGGATPLHRAAYCGHTAIAKLLLDHGADPAATDDDGKTCLHKAAENGHQEVCELIMAQHPQLRHLRDNSQRRPGDLVPAKNEDLRRKLLDL